jgi:hypothetical protein
MALLGIGNRPTAGTKPCRVPRNERLYSTRALNASEAVIISRSRSMPWLDPGRCFRSSLRSRFILLLATRTYPSTDSETVIVWKSRTEPDEFMGGIKSARQARFRRLARFRRTLGCFPGSFEFAVRPWNGTCPLLTSTAHEFLFG